MPNEAALMDKSQLRDALVRSIKGFSLSYEQHQLIHSSSFGLLVSHIRAKRKRLTIALVALSMFSLIQGVHGVLAYTSYVPWAVCSVVCGVWAFRRYSKTRSMLDAFDAYSAAGGDVQVKPSTLAEELKLGFDLAYGDHQAIRAGNPRDAARAIIARRKANSRAFGLGAAFISVIAVVIWGLFGVGFAVLIWIGFAASYALDRSVAARAQSLLDRYPHAGPDNSGEQCDATEPGL
ncbi:hypothetical protein [Roseimaritima sediminicola]|uniref:hypothetical protein n=1 Tax=Roseimaritima sediminicola TaxID=2662066 RepID=UPI00129829A6|nr:hypothetical protein [Roseimaritima sediminicola]